MEIHKPKPVHSWREFLTEIGTIICGIVIALGGEQVVEAAHWSDRVREAEALMRKELTEDNGPQAYYRLSQARCIDGQLNTLEKALLTERDAHVALVPHNLTIPSFFTWDSDGYRQAIASSAIAHMSPERSYAWASPYTMMADLDATSLREANDYADLNLVSTAPPHPSEALRERLLASISRARGDNALMKSSAGALIKYLEEPGVTLDERHKRLRLDRGVDFADCSALIEPG